MNNLAEINKFTRLTILTEHLAVHGKYYLDNYAVKELQLPEKYHSLPGVDIHSE